MKASWHESAVIHPSAILGHGVYIGPNCRVGANVVVGSYTVIGGLPEHRDFYDDVDLVRSKGVWLQDGVRVFEFVSIHAGTERMTVLGEWSAVFNHTHVAHDVIVGRKATIAGPSSIGGFCEIQDFATVGGGSLLHQKSTVGAFSFLGAGSFLKGHLPPGELWMGRPARPAGLNQVGLTRANMSLEQVLQEHGEKFHRARERSGLK